MLDKLVEMINKIKDTIKDKCLGKKPDVAVV